MFKPRRNSPSQATQDLLSDMGPQYHSYSFFGVENAQIEGLAANQTAKELILRAYFQYAIAKCRPDPLKPEMPVSFAELFCADGYFAMMARKLGASVVRGYDNDKQGCFESAKVIAARLGLDNVTFIKADVNDIETFEPADIVANIGGLYHVSNPKDILAKSYAMAKRYLIIQSVVSLATDDPDYFVQPAPGWKHGSRFSRASFDKVIRESGYNVIDSHFNIFHGNKRPEDQGGVYYLVQK